MARKQFTSVTPRDDKIVSFPTKEREFPEGDMRAAAQYALEELQNFIAEAVREHERKYHGRSNTVTLR